MKKMIFILVIISCTILIKNVKAEGIIIPDEAIRLRVIANSNTEDDQKIKMEVRNSLEKRIYEILKDVNSYSVADTLMKENINIFDQAVYNIVKNNDYQLNYGQNSFPSKEYRGVIYPAGQYNSLVVTLGQGQGDNWWCVLFPPLCLLEASESDKEVEYTTFIGQLLNNFIK